MLSRVECMKKVFLLLLPMLTVGCQTNGHNSKVNSKPVAPVVIATPTPKSVPSKTQQPDAALTSAFETNNALNKLNAQPMDLWHYISEDFQLPVPNNQRVTAQRNWYIKHPNYMKRVSKRAEPFLYLIVDQLQDKNIPLELALLPIVESAFDPFAYSHGRASGLWQFIPGTAKRFGMEQNWWYDGRRDVVRSTESAIRYLSYLNRYFDGDWLHAIAAYNSGEGRVKRAIKKNQKAGKPTDFWSLDLPKETKAYVPKLLALADLIKHQDKYGVEIPMIENRYRLTQINVGSQIDLAMAADMAGLDIKHLQQLNPGYNRWATPPQGPHTLLLPYQAEDPFLDSLAKLTPQQRLKWTRYTVVSGDTLGTIAQKYHTSSQTIRAVNGLSGNMIRLNQALLIPIASKELKQYGLSRDQRLAKTKATPRGKYKITHKVKSGDNFWDLGLKYKVSHRKIAKWNGMAPTDPLRLNQVLVIWQDSNSSSSKVTTPAMNNAIMRKISYKVRNGDSLSVIANKFKVKVADVIKWNSISKNKYLQPGQRLKLYIDVTRT